jgi:peptide/nickel transport system permease protein
MLILLVMGSIVSFVVIVLPPGDYLTSYVMQLKAQGTDIGEAEIASLRRMYGLDQPMYVQFFKWVWKVLHLDLGYSFQWNQPVTELIRERIGMTILVSLGSLILTYVIAIPTGIYSAVRQYSIGDYLFTIVGFIGVAVPNFLLALILIVFLNRNFDMSAGGLLSTEFKGQPWSWAKLVDLLKHLPLPVIVIGTSGTASLIRVMRGVLLDEINRPYVTTARAKGLKESRLLTKYPVRVALNPIVSSLGWMFPAIFSGQTIAAIVLDLPTIGPLLYQALMQEDMFLASSVVLINTTLTVVGMLISDILLAWLDPRIRFTA